jgi:hypothetical protein
MRDVLQRVSQLSTATEGCVRAFGRNTQHNIPKHVLALVNDTFLLLSIFNNNMNLILELLILVNNQAIFTNALYFSGHYIFA